MIIITDIAHYGNKKAPRMAGEEGKGEKMEVEYKAIGLAEKIDIVNKAIDHLNEAQRLITQASQISVEVVEAFSEQL
jgi:hypothetical protein